MKSLITLCLILSACVTDEPEPNVCGPAPVQPGYAISTPGNGTVVLSLDQWTMQTTWANEMNAWADCVEGH